MVIFKVLHIHRWENGHGNDNQDNGRILAEIQQALKAHGELLNSLTLKIDQIMTKQERFDAILTGLNDVTNKIAADYQTLLDEVRNGTVSDESLAKAEENIAKLNEIAASNDQPVPGEEIPPADETGGGTV